MNMKGMKEIKRIPMKIVAYIVVIALCMVYLGTPVGTKDAMAVTSNSGEWEYIENGNGTVSVIKYYGMVNNLAVPEMIDDKTLIRIGEGTFNCNTNLRSVIIANNVTDIGQYAFYDCSNLEEAMLPGSLVNIGQFAFGECFSLRSITIPDSVTTIGASAFADCISLNRVTVSEMITSILDNTFFGCTNLSNVDLPNNLNKIGDGVFSGCSSLDHVVLPDSLTYIGTTAFGGCGNLSRLDVSKNVTYIGENAFSGCSNLVIYTTSGSYAETYAKEHGIAFQLTDAPEVTPEPPSPTPTVTPSPTPTVTPSLTPTLTPSPTPTVTPSPTPTITPSPTPTVTPSPTPTITPSPTPTATPTVTPSPTPIVTPKPIATPDGIVTPEPTWNPTITFAPVSTPTPGVGDNNNNTGKKSQIIHAKSITKEYGSKPFNLGAYADSYSALSYSSSNKKVATVDGYGWVTVKGYGSSVITVKAPEAEEYKKASKKITVTIIPKKVAVKALKSTAAKKAVYSWKKDRTVSGYQIYVSLKKDFNSNTFQRVIKSSTSLSLRGLRSRKTYYFKVRSYKLVGKKKFYSKWSMVKKVKIK